MKTLLIATTLLLAGCASNGILVEERTPDGSLLTVKQHTVSTLGAKTKEGAGDFVYTGESPDGSKFDMRAGAAVLGQETPDPTQAILEVVGMLAPTPGLQAPASPATPITPPLAREGSLRTVQDRVDRLERLLSDLIER